VVRLERNYRSTEPIVEAANRLMRGRPGALQLRAVAAEARAESPAAEPVPSGLSGPSAPSSIGSAPGEPGTIGPATTSNAVPDVAPGRSSAARPRGEEPVVTSYADELAEARGVATVIRNRIDAGAAPEQIAVLMRVNSQSAMLEHALDEVGVASRIRGNVRFFDQPEVRQAVQALRAAALTIANEPLFKSVSDVLRSLGWTAQAPDGPGAVRGRWESLNALARLVDDAPAGTTFRAFADDLRARAEAQHEPTVQAVTLATLHSAKGLEWDEVHIVGLTEGMLPIAYAKGFDAIDEERRLFYVGVTRARRRLSLSWARLGGQQRATREESRFLQELGTRTPDAPRARDGDRRSPAGRS